MSGPGLAFDAVVTLEDMVAFHQRLLASAMCAPFGLVLATWVVGLEDPNGMSFAEVVDHLPHARPELLAEAAVVVAGCIAATNVAQRLLVRPRLRRVLRRVLRARPDVDPADPRLVFRTHVVVSDDGLESRSAAGSTMVRWNAIDRWEEAGGRLMVIGNAMNGFCLTRPPPK